MSKKIKTGLVHLKFWCTTQVIDKLVAEKKGIVWSQALADNLEEKSRHYFIIDKKNNVAVVPHTKIEKSEEVNGVVLWNKLENCEITPEIETIINQYIKDVHMI